MARHRRIGQCVRNEKNISTAETKTHEIKMPARHHHGCGGHPGRRFIAARRRCGQLHPPTSRPWTAPDSYEQGRTNNLNSYYHCNELSVDGFGMGSVGSYTLENPSEQRIRHNSEAVPARASIISSPGYVGVDGEAYSQNTTGTFVDNADGNLLLRLPLGQSGFAPYALGRRRPPVRCGQAVVWPGRWRHGIPLLPACGRSLLTPAACGRTKPNITASAGPACVSPSKQCSSRRRRGSPPALFLLRFDTVTANGI